MRGGEVRGVAGVGRQVIWGVVGTWWCTRVVLVVRGEALEVWAGQA